MLLVLRGIFFKRRLGQSGSCFGFPVLAPGGGRPHHFHNLNIALHFFYLWQDTRAGVGNLIDLISFLNLVV